MIHWLQSVNLLRAAGLRMDSCGTLWFYAMFSHIGSSTGWAIGLIGALILSSCVFGFAHLYQGAAGIVQTTILGAIFGLIFIVTGSLLLPMILHALIDLRILLILKADRRSLSSEASTHGVRN